MSTDDAPILTPEQAAHSAAVRAALNPTVLPNVTPSGPLGITYDSYGQWAILVYCDDEYHEKPWDIGEFRISTPLDREWLSVWMLHLRGAEKQHQDRVREAFEAGAAVPSAVEFNPAAQYLAGDRQMRKPREFGVSISEAELRYRIECECGYTFEWRRRPVRGEDKLNIGLDKLAMHGQRKVSLSGLSRIVTL